MFSLHYLLTRLSRIAFLVLMLLTIVLLPGAKSLSGPKLLGSQISKESHQLVNPFTTLSFEENEELEAQSEFGEPSDIALNNAIFEFASFKDILPVASQKQTDFSVQGSAQLFIRLRKILV